MDFFAAQDRARRKTLQLVLLFAIAIAGLIVATNLLVGIVVAFSTTAGLVNGPTATLQNQPTQTWVMITVGVLICIGGASLYKYLALRSGGRAIAEMLGGRPIDPGTQALDERRLLNVVEEMSIASGIRVPAVYRVDEDGINAFAAGFGTDDAVVCVTKGTLERLNREELQGVIGHEFSHVLNGDARLNLRLIALLNGILFIGLVGRILLRSNVGGGSRRNSGGAAVLALGVGLIAIGAAGTLCGNLIKAAVSRQREFLADAASVQFTRNPHGIANALKKIGGATSGSILANVRANEASHMFFSQAVKLFFGGMMATHPPLPARIRAIEPSWDGQYIAGAPIVEMDDAPPGASGFADGAAVDTPDAVVAAIGNPTTASVAHAQGTIASLPQHVVDAARDPWGACALVYAMLLPCSDAGRQRLLEMLEPHVIAHLDEIEPTIVELDDAQRLTLVALACPALMTMSRPQYDRFVADVIALIRADRRIDLFEWVLHRVLLKSLKPHFEGPTATTVRYRTLDGVRPQIAETLSAIARAGGHALDAQQRAFEAGAAAVEMNLQFIANDDVNFVRLNDALRDLRGVHPLAKPRLIKGCAACALTDGVMPSERALLIGIAATLDCPLPPDLALPT
ncbi:MAG TPA: M48 family metallopeptidase [Pseudomonadales bacterium]|nr:M48 family metallopeptidase [Pseudomonadales bacterium]